jgi:hypothetical protein
MSWIRRTGFVVAVAVAIVGATSRASAAGTLDFDPAGAPTIGDFQSVTIRGVPQLTSLTVAPFTIVDDTASGAGWHVLLTVSDLVNGGDVIAASEITMAAPIVTAAVGSSLTGVSAHAAAGGFASGEKIVVASVGNGAGTFHISPFPLKLLVPADALAGSYSSAATIAVISGP